VAALDSITLNPSTIPSQGRPTATVRLTAPAPAGGVTIALDSTNEDVAKVPSGMSIAAGDTANTIVIDVKTVPVRTDVRISATYLGVTMSSILTVLPPALGARFSVTSPSKGTDACSIINSAGNVDCQFDARASEGIVSQYRWTVKVGAKEKSFGFPEGQPVITPPIACDTLSGAGLNSNGNVLMTVSLVVQDRQGNQSSVTSKDVEITHNSVCGY
jgi:hypothetical protein